MIGRFTLTLLAVVVSAGSVLTVSPNANAESRRYCENNRCERQYYHRDSQRHNRHRDRWRNRAVRQQRYRQRYYKRQFRPIIAFPRLMRYA